MILRVWDRDNELILNQTVTSQEDGLRLGLQKLREIEEDHLAPEPLTEDCLALREVRGRKTTRWYVGIGTGIIEVDVAA